MASAKFPPKIPQEIINVTLPTLYSSLELAMKAQVTQNEKLDSLSIDLFRTTALTNAEIEQIIAGEELFSSVRAQIIADNVTRLESTSTITFFQRSAILTAAAAIIVVAVFGTMMVAKRTNQRPNVAAIPPVRSYDDTVVSPVDLPISQPKSEVSEERPTAVHIVKAMDYRPVVSERRPYSPPPQQQQELEDQPPQFFALAGLRPAEVAVDGSRIIRVELPRASLVTLGVNVPLDSDKQLIKTDLLVGPDGVPRAIRLVD